jgi:urea carboxylase
VSGIETGGIEADRRVMPAAGGIEADRRGMHATGGIEVLSPGTLTTVQDWPGRVGYWAVGVPPSGPMDSRSLRIANRLVGNGSRAAGLEATLVGPKLRFEQAAVVAVTGAPLRVTLDGVTVPQWAPFPVPAGGVLALGTIRSVGVRAYVAVRGGLVGELELGSRSVFASAGLGGQPLRRGDTLAIAAGETVVAPDADELRAAIPDFANDVALRVVLGPHGAPDFLTRDGLAELLDATWTVDPNSNRTGIRLVGPRPGWARADGGEAGLHPSNILDSAYSVGTVMLAGDMAVIVGPDGPSLGGFTAIAQVARADLWRLGQLRVGDRVTLEPIEPVHAALLQAAGEALVDDGSRPAVPVPVPVAAAKNAAPRAAIDGHPRDGAHGPISFRRAGECAVLVEFGEPLVDLRSRVRAHALDAALAAECLPGVLDVTAGVRSLHVQHDPDRLAAEDLVDALAQLEASSPAPEQLAIPGRTVRLPLAWRHSEAMRAVERYQASVRSDAPWCPDNIDFIRRINGLPDEDAVRAIVTDAAYLVLGLGDVYLGAPVAVPLDPRHVLVTTKYNPARTWTPANAVGIGGAFLCVYGMEGPGGYQLVGRTVPVWHAGDDPPWRLRHFDQLRFELVSEPELEELRARSHAGEWAPATEPAHFSLSEHERFLAANTEAIADFTRRREAAFAAERRAWVAADEAAGVAA